MQSDRDVFRYVTPETLLAARHPDGNDTTWSAGIICFRNADGSNRLIEALDARPVTGKMLYGKEAADADVFEADFAGQQVGVVTRCIWGGPQAAILAEELATLGVRTLVGFGACGAIAPELVRHQQVLVSRALPTDGTTAAYTGDVLPADPMLTDAALAAAEAAGVDVRCVTAATVDALYRETRPMVEQLRFAGADIINMETSPFYAAARAAEARCVWIGCVTDRLADSWEDWLNPPAETIDMTTNWLLELLGRILQPAPVA